MESDPPRRRGRYGSPIVVIFCMRCWGIGRFFCIFTFYVVFSVYFHQLAFVPLPPRKRPRKLAGKVICSQLALYSIHPSRDFVCWLSLSSQGLTSQNRLQLHFLVFFLLLLLANLLHLWSRFVFYVDNWVCLETMVWETRLWTCLSRPKALCIILLKSFSHSCFHRAGIFDTYFN